MKHHSPSRRREEVNGYLLLTEIGKGASGCVRIAKKNDSICCAKIIMKSTFSNEEDHKFLMREVEALKKIDHKNIVKFYDFYEDEANIYIFQEYCPGKTLKKYIEEVGAISENHAAIILMQLMSALSYINELNIAHRDLKLENIIISTGDSIKLIDFGFCSTHSNVLSQTFCGSPIYAAPECILGKPYNSMKSDIWSSGVILYTMVTGEYPWDVSNINVMVNKIVRGEYSFNTTMSFQCKNLIGFMLSVDAVKRKTPKEILNSQELSALIPHYYRSPSRNFNSPLIKGGNLQYTRCSAAIIKPSNRTSHSDTKAWKRIPIQKSRTNHHYNLTLKKI